MPLARLPTMTPIARAVTTAAIVAIAVATAVLFFSTRADKQAEPESGASSEVSTVPDAGQLVRDNSRRLNSAPGGKVTFVEFLDFECEGCRAAFPMVEQLRRDYADRVNFVIRYFPLRSHFNAERAARAVEAAAQQDKLEAMYQKMYQTQPQWGERSSPADSVFRGFATELGLNMDTFDAAYNDPATAARVQLDVADGRALGVMSTPSFFINADPIVLTGPEDLARALQTALRKTG